LAFHSGREADHSPPSSAEVEEWVELNLHSPNAPSWRGAQLGGAQGQLLKWAGHVALMGEIRNSYKVLVGAREEKRLHGRCWRR
jgi:hypothetical protein